MALGATTADVTGIVYGNLEDGVRRGAGRCILALGSLACWFRAIAVIMLDTFRPAGQRRRDWLVLLASAAAAYVPSRRAAQVDPANYAAILVTYLLRSGASQGS